MIRPVLDITLDKATNLHPGSERAERKRRFLWYEEQLKDSMMSLARLFRDMRKDKFKPYLETHASFEAYCSERWGIGPRRAQQMIEAETVRELLCEAHPELAPIVGKMKEEPLRLLGKAPEEEQPDLLKKAAAISIKGVVTGSALKAAMGRPPRAKKVKLEPVDAEYQPITTHALPAPSPAVCPHCQRPL